MRRLDRDLLEDVAAASAAYLFNVLPQVAAMPDTQRFDRLTTHFVAAIEAYLAGEEGWDLEPSQN